MTFPELVVFDLDDCVWSPETYTLDALPSKTKVTRADLNGRGNGIAGTFCNGDEMFLHPGALHAFQQHLDGKYPNTKFALASSAVTPFATKCAHAALQILEVVPGTTVIDVININWPQSTI